MLWKIPGNYHIEKLWVIQLLEADIQMYLHLIWGKRLVHNTTKHKLSNNKQMGSQPGFLGWSAPLLKVLLFDFIQVPRSSATIFNNNLTAYYDRFIQHFPNYAARD